MSAWIDLPVLACTEAQPLRPVALRAGLRLSHADWLRRVDAWQAAFETAGGRRWALLHDDAFEFAAALYGAWHAGVAVVLPADAQADTLRRLAGEVDGLAGELPGGLQAQEAAPPRPRQPLDLQTTQLLLYTSGSSGEPVAIAKALHQLQAEVEVQQGLHGRDWLAGGLEGERAPEVWSTVSHQHIYGLLFVVLWPLAAGACTVVPRRIYLEDFAARAGPAPALLVSSPAHLRRLPPEADWTAARGVLRAVLSSGGPLPPEAALEAAAQLGQAPIEIYGSSETGGIAWRQRTHQGTEGDRWTPLPRVQLRIDDGHLSVRSPFLGDDGWFETADLVRAEAEGHFVLLGRSDRIVKIEERRVSLTAVERALKASPLVAEARALTISRQGGTRVAAVIVASPAGQERLRAADGGRAALAQALRAALRDDIERLAVPRFWRVVEALPVNPQGKVTEAALRRLFDEPAPWRWLRREVDSAEAERSVEACLLAFEGHFPGAPILPGVVQLDWAIEAAREAFGLPPSAVRLELLKFQQPVRPGLRLRLTLQWDAARRRLQFRFESPLGVHASGRVQFTEPAEGARGSA